MSLGLILSIILHLVCLGFLFFGVSFWPSPELSPPLSIPIEIINISELSVAPKPQRTREAPVQAPPPTPTPAPEPMSLPDPVEPEKKEPALEEPMVQEAPTPPLPIEELVAPEPKLDPPPPQENPPIAPPSKPKRKTSPEEGPKKEKKKEGKKKKKDDPFDDVLKAVEDLKAPAERQPKNGELSDKTQVNEAAIVGEVLSISELDALRRQFSQCWSPPTGLEGAEEMIVDLAVSINPDGSVQEVRILDQARYSKDPRFQPAADAARRAVLNPACNPLKIPAHKYNLLKSFVLKFNPSEMF